MKEGQELKHLGSERTEYEYEKPEGILEAFENRYTGYGYEVNLIFPEFTSCCPKTGQPDFATIKIDYVPDKLCIESKSLKLYFFAYRNYQGFMETIVNLIRDDLVRLCSPIELTVTGEFNARGGVKINVTSTFKK